MPKVDDFKDFDGKLNVAEVEKVAIPINRKGQVESEKLDLIRQKLAGNDLALQHIGGFLNYANTLLTLSENNSGTQFADRRYAEVEYGNHIFIFRRM